MMEQNLEVKNTSKTRYVQPCIRIRLLSHNADIVTASGYVNWLTDWGDSFNQNRDNTFIGGVD